MLIRIDYEIAMEAEARERILEWLKERSQKIEERLERLREKIIGKVEHNE